jgi:EmrB/QacA subfamily drug resistance transporter
MVDTTNLGGWSGRRRWGALALIVTAQFMVILDVAIVNVALPSIKTDLHFSQESLQWVITAYAIMFGGVLLLGGRLADLFGRRRLFITGVALFTGSSLLSGLAWSESSLIVFRALQGLGGALLAPAALSILITTFREGRDRNIALGVYGAASGSGGSAGVLLGGVLTSSLNWSWIFFINVPVGLIVIALAPRLLREGRARMAHRHLDLAGATTSTSGLMLLVYAMTRATEHGWETPETIVLLVAAASLLVAFVAVELRSKAPLLPMRIFRLRTLATANAIAVVIGSISFSQFFLLSLYMQEVLRYSALTTGLAYIAITLTIAVGANLAQKLVTRFGARPTLTTGLLLSAVALGLYTRLPPHGHYFWDIFPGFIIGGVGFALCFVPVTIAGLSGIHPADSGIASGLINTTRQIGGAIGLAAVSTIAATYTNSYVQDHPGSTALGGAALTHGFQFGFVALTGLALLGAVIALTLPVGRAQAHAVGELPERQPVAAEAA